MKKPEVISVKDETVDPARVESKLRVWFPDLSASTVKSLGQMSVEISNSNKALSLVASATIAKIDSLHIADSVFASRLILKSLIKDKPVFDIGSGNGLPGLVLALLKPDLPVVLVDRDERKLGFCSGLAKAFGLANVSVQHATIEQLPDKSIFNVVMRGNSPFARALLAGRKPVTKTGRFFHLKGDGWANELAQMPSQLFTHWSPHLLGQYRLPDSSSDMFVVMTEKMSD